LTGFQSPFEFYEVGLEAMIVGCVAHRSAILCGFFQFLQILRSVTQERFFHQDVLAMTEQVAKDWQFGCVRSAHECRIIFIGRHSFDLLVYGLRLNGVHGYRHIGSCDSKAFPALNAQTCDGYSQ